MPKLSHLPALLLGAALLAPLATADHHQKPAGPEGQQELALIDAADLDRAAEMYRQDPDAHPVLQRAVADADEALEAPLRSVTDKKHAPPSGDTHDYWSIAPYWWPDPATEDGLPWIRKDGQVNPDTRDPDFTDIRRFQHTCEDALTLALAYKLTGETKYADRAAEVLRTWFLDEETAMNPNLSYSQGVPGRNDGRPAGLIESTSAIGVTEAARILRGSEAWSAEDDEALRGWFSDFIEWMSTSDIGVKESKMSNNHGTWYAAQQLAFGLYADPDAVNPNAVRRHFEGMIDDQIDADGTQPHELTRTKTLSYHTMNLCGFGTIANAARLIDLDLWHADPQLEKAFETIVPGILNRDDWPHKQINEPATNVARDAMNMAHDAFGDAAYERAAESKADPAEVTLYDVAAVGAE